MREKEFVTDTHTPHIQVPGRRSFKLRTCVCKNKPSPGSVTWGRVFVSESCNGKVGTLSGGARLEEDKTWRRRWVGKWDGMGCPGGRMKRGEGRGYNGW